MSDWAVLRAFSGKEIELQNRFDGIYCPQCVVWRKAKGLRRKVPTQKPLFPGYVFTVVELAHLRDSSVLGAIYFDGRLARVKGFVVDHIKNKEKRGSYDFTKPGSGAPKIGEIIRPLEGAFTGIRFIYHGIKGEQMTLAPLDIASIARVLYEGEWEGEGE